MRFWPILLLPALSAGFTAAASPPAITTYASRTAIWPGDRFEYVVRIEHGPELELVKDRFKKDEVNLRPFEALDVSTARGELAGGARYDEVRFLLTTFVVNQPHLEIPQLTLFYFRQGRDRNDTAADAINVPPFPMAVREAVVDASQGIRDRRPPLPIRGASWIVPAILGWLGLAAIACYLVWLAVVQVRSGFWKRRMAERARRKSLWQSVREIQQTSADSKGDLEKFYERANDVLRSLAAQRLQDRAGLTPSELKVELTAAGDSEHHATVLSELLAECDAIRYAPDGVERASQAHPEFVRKFEELTQHR
jgi:hypothetical protein